MTGIQSLILETPEPGAAERLYADAFDLGDLLQVRSGDAPTSGFRGFAISLVVAQPNVVDLLFDAAVRGGAASLKPAAKSFWGYGGVVQAPDGTIWKFASSAKKNSGSAERVIQEVVLLLGVDDVKTTKQFYVDRGMPVAKSFGSKYVEFDATGAPVKLALYTRKAAAKDVGVGAEGTGSHRLAIAGDVDPFTDPDGFTWETSARAEQHNAGS